MPADNFIVCQWPFANSLNPDEDQLNVSLDLTVRHSDGGPGWFMCKNSIFEESQQTKIKT